MRGGARLAVAACTGPARSPPPLPAPQDQQDGITTVFRWEGRRDVGRRDSFRWEGRRDDHDSLRGGARFEGPHLAPGGAGLRWAERCLQCLGRDFTITQGESTTRYDASRYDATRHVTRAYRGGIQRGGQSDGGLEPLERAIAGCLRGMRISDAPL